MSENINHDLNTEAQAAQISKPVDPLPRNTGSRNIDSFRARLNRVALPIALAIGVSSSSGIPNKPADPDGFPSGPQPTDISGNSDDSFLRTQTDTIVIPTNPVDQSAAEEQSDPAEKIRAFVSETGQEPLTFEQARDIIPSLAELFSKTGKRFSAEEMTKRIFIIDGQATSEDTEYVRSVGLNDDSPDQNFNIPLFKRIKEHYPEIQPGVDIDASTLSLVYEFLKEGETIGFTHLNNVFVFLEAVNGVKKYENIIDLQYDEFGADKCTEAQPSVMLASTIGHEIFHQNSPSIGLPVNEAIQENFDILELDFKPTEIFSSGFAIYISDYQEGVETSGESSLNLSGLDEFVVQHLANQISMQNGIPAVTIGENAPKDSANFQAILDQAGISLEELEEMHRNSDLDGFFKKVVESIPDVEFSSEDEKVAVGFLLFSSLMINNYNWEEYLGEYFPGVDTRYYQKNNRPNILNNFAGCAVPKIQMPKN